jgi:hypothetical protein
MAHLAIKDDNTLIFRVQEHSTVILNSPIYNKSLADVTLKK